MNSEAKDLVDSKKYFGQSVDLENLAQRVKRYLQENGLTVMLISEQEQFLLQIKKTNFSYPFQCDIDTYVKIFGTPNEFEVSIKYAEKNSSRFSTERITLYDHKESNNQLYSVFQKIRQFIDDEIFNLKNSINDPSLIISYDARYVSGYPGWTKKSSGKLVLVKDNKRIILKFTSFTKSLFGTEATLRHQYYETDIKASSIKNIKIVSERGRIRSTENKMIQIQYRDDGGDLISLVFDLHDDIINSVVRGINYLRESV